MVTFFRTAAMLLLVVPAPSLAQAQDTILTIEKCYELARKNYPAILKQDLIAQTANYTLTNASKAYLPQFMVNGQATYQSETIAFPKGLTLPGGGSFPEISKDQYRVQAELNQQIYDGGALRQERELIRANEKVRQQEVAVTLYAVEDRIEQLYFSILLLGEQIKQFQLRNSNLSNLIAPVGASVSQGTAYKSALNELKAEVAQGEMGITELNEKRKAFINTLSVLIHQTIPPATDFRLPKERPRPAQISRPELSTFDLIARSIDAKTDQLSVAWRPKISAFAQGAYGRPTLNIIENKSGPWFIGGIRLAWSLGSLYTIGNQRRILETEKKSLAADREIFLLNTKMELSQIDGDVAGYKALLSRDQEIIDLRTAVTASSAAQLKNGVITTHDYINQVNAENLARQTQILHSIQLLQSNYHYQHTAGHP